VLQEQVPEELLRAGPELLRAGRSDVRRACRSDLRRSRGCVLQLAEESVVFRVLASLGPEPGFAASNPLRRGFL
jgi:hypothetical protein